MLKWTVIITFAEILALFIAIAKGRAEENQPLTLDQCIQFALQNNPPAHIAAQAELSAKEDVAVARGRYYPDVGVRSTYRRWETHAFLPNGILLPQIPSVIGPVNEWQTDLRANYTLFDSGLRSSQLRASEAQYSAAKEDSSRTRADIRYQVHSSFYQLLAAEDQIELVMSRSGRSKDHLKLAEVRKAAGDVPLADVTRARVEVSSADLSLAEARNNTKRQTHELC